MDEYRHHVSGFFAHREEAEGAVTRLVERGVPRNQLQLFDADSGPVVAEPKGESGFRIDANFPPELACAYLSRFAIAKGCNTIR